MGKISFADVKRVAKELGENMTDEELQEMIDETRQEKDVDENGNGVITIDSFHSIMKQTNLFSHY